MVAMPVAITMLAKPNKVSILSKSTVVDLLL